MDNNKPQKRKSYAKPLNMVLSGTIEASQPGLFGGYVSSLLIRKEGQLPQLLEVRSQNAIPLGEFSGSCRIMVEGTWLQERRG